MVHTGHVVPTGGNSGCLKGQPDHFVGSHAMITYNFKNSRIGVWSYFGPRSGHEGFKSRLIQKCSIIAYNSELKYNK